MEIAEEDYSHMADMLPKEYRSRLGEFLDPRDPSLKRKEFNKIRNQIYAELKEAEGEKCQLRYECCDEGSGFDVDHIFPLSSNVLNKMLRNMTPPEGKKVPAQSIGSNNRVNLILACKKCNGHKKHRLIRVEVLKRILEHRPPL